MLHFQSCPASRDFFPGCLLAYTCSKSFASPKAMPGRTFARRVVQSFSFAFFFSFPSSLSGSQRGGPWSSGALKSLLWSPEPYHFTDWSPDPFLAVEPGAQRHFARSPEPSIFKFDHSSSQIALILDYCLFVFVCAC